MNSFRRTIDTEVSEVGDDRYRAVSRLTDSFHEIEVVIIVCTADFSIVEASAQMIRMPYVDRCPNSLLRINNLSGIRIGPGLSKTIREAVGGNCGCPYLVELAVQACKLVIVATRAKQAREAVLGELDMGKFTEIHQQMGECAGHRDLPTGRLPDWLEQERKQNQKLGKIPKN